MVRRERIKRQPMNERMVIHSMTDYYDQQPTRREKFVEDSEDGVYAKGLTVTLDREEAIERENRGECIPVGGWQGAKDMGETKTDEEAGYGYGPLAVAARNSNVTSSFDNADLAADAEAGDPAFVPGSAVSGASDDSRLAADAATLDGSEAAARAVEEDEGSTKRSADDVKDGGATGSGSGSGSGS